MNDQRDYDQTEGAQNNSEYYEHRIATVVGGPAGGSNDRFGEMHDNGHRSLLKTKRFGKKQIIYKRRKNNYLLAYITCLGGIPVSVATATKCAVAVLRSDRSPSTMSPESSMTNILW